MNKHTKLGCWLLAAALAMPAAAWAQKAAPDDPNIMDFDKAVAAMPSIAKDIDMTLDVIGFDIRKGSAEEKQLADTAAAGVGKYFPVAKPEDLAKIFTQVTTGVAMGGGGGMVLPTPGGLSPLLIGLIVLGLGAVALLIGIVALQRRRTEPAFQRAPAGRAARGGVRVSARLDVYYADGGAKTVQISEERTTIGRREDNAVPLHDSAASGVHAEILATAGGFVIRDLGSANGTFVNGRRVTESPIYLGDEVKIGTTRLVLGE